MAEYILIHMIEKKPIGTDLGLRIPLHMTALHWFSSDKPPAEIIEKTDKALLGIGKIATIATEEDLFGEDRNVPVLRLSKSLELVELHTSLLRSMAELDAIFDERWTGPENWNPHVTHQPNSRLYPGDEVLICDIDVIVRDNSDSKRSIIARIPLKDG